MANVLKIIIISLVFNIISCQIVASYSNIKSRKDKSDLPAHKDYQVYLNSLQRIVIFFLNNKNYLNLNILFGLFLVNVHLRHFTKHEVIPVSVRNDLEYLSIQIDELQDVRYDDEFIHKNAKMNISFLFSNDTVWSKRTPKLIFRSSTPTHAYPLPNWSTYQRAVEDIDRIIPHPRLSDVCLEALAQNDENLLDHPQRCELPTKCYEALLFGSNYGYGLTHRLLLLIEARLSRGCFLFSSSMDELMRSSFCELAYGEAEYNARNGFRNADLVFEHMALCSLEGHAGFLRKSWLSKLLQYQTQYGCFDENLPVVPRKHFFEDQSSAADEGHCSGHVTAVAAAALAPAIRYILENY